jgi:hypothetical protein
MTLMTRRAAEPRCAREVEIVGLVRLLEDAARPTNSPNRSPERFRLKDGAEKR